MGKNGPIILYGPGNGSNVLSWCHGKCIGAIISNIFSPGQGLGKLLAQRLARDNNTLHCVDINTDLNEKTGKELRRQGDVSVFTYTCDVGSLEGVRELGREIKGNTPDRHLSYLFNVAGV